MLRTAIVIALLASPAVADNCEKAQNLRANHLALINGMAAILDACENDDTTACQIARATDEKIKETGTPNGTGLLLLLPMSLCQ